MQGDDKAGQLALTVWLTITTLAPSQFILVHQLVLIGVLLVAGAYAVRRFWQIEIRFESFLIWFALLMVYWWAVIRGYIGNAYPESYSETIRLYVIYPLIYLFLSVLFCRPSGVKALHRTFLYVGSVSAILIITYYTCISLDLIVPNKSKWYNEGRKYVDTLAFFTMYISGCWVASLRFKATVPRANIIIFILLLVAGVMAGRRGIWLIDALAVGWVFMAYVVYVYRKGTVQPQVITSLVAGVVLAVSLLIITNIGHSFANGLGYLVDAFTQSERVVQIQMLLKSMDLHIVFGNGFGTGIPGVMRSSTEPWRYELTYIKLVYQGGILGVAVFLFVGLYAMARLLKMGHLNVAYWGQFGGLLGLLLAMSTNPYWLSYRHGWMFYIPVLLGLSILKTRKEKPIKARDCGNGNYGIY